MVSTRASRPRRSPPVTPSVVTSRPRKPPPACEADRWYSASLRSDPEDAQVRSRLALALIGSVQGPAYDDPPVADSARAAIRQKLEDAEGLLTTAIDTYRRRERRQELHEALVSR